MAEKSLVCACIPVPLVDDLEVPPLQEAAHLGFAGQHHLHQFPDHLLLVPLGRGRVPLLETQLPLPTEQQHETHHFIRFTTQILTWIFVYELLDFPFRFKHSKRQHSMSVSEYYGSSEQPIQPTS